MGRRQGEWTGNDVPDFEKTKPPDYRPPEGAVGVEALRGDDPFIMQADGKGWLFAPNGVLDGPMPTHYEPHESPVRNAMYAQQGNPARMVYGREDNPSNPSPPEAHGEVFPFVFTAARLTEHHTAGGMSRQLPYLSELQPALFVEVSPQLAAERGLTHMEWAHVITSRTAVDARVFVTDRMRPLRIEDRVVHQIWMPYHWGGNGLVDGDVVNDLLGVVLDPNVFIQESKVATCDIQPGRRPRGPALLDYIAAYRDRAGITADTGTHLDTTGPSRAHGGDAMSDNSFYGPLDDPAGDAGYTEHPSRVGLLHRHVGVHRLQGVRGGVQGMERGARRRVRPAGDVVRQHGRAGREHLAACGVHRAARAAVRSISACPGFRAAGRCDGGGDAQDFRWLMSSDVCKHCTHAGCLDVCPTGALFRTEFGTVVVQQDICNGCGYCVSGCPYGVIERREGDGRAWKCTLCYDRLHDGLEPACAKACPTDSIQFGALDELRERAAQRVEELHSRGVTEARLYGHDPNDGVGGDGAFFLLLDEPEVYGLPPDPVVPTRDAGGDVEVRGDGGLGVGRYCGVGVRGAGAGMTGSRARARRRHTRTAGGAAGGVPVVLRAADPEDAGMELDDRGVPVPGGLSGGVGDAGAPGRT